MPDRSGDVEWFERTGHCGQCGQPGSFCLCIPRSQCGCRALHEMSSGVAADAVDVFADNPVVQDGLFS